MRKVSKKLRDEARRLLSLSPEELEVERVAPALRLGVESEQEAEALSKLDTDVLESLLNPTQMGVVQS